MNFEIFENIRYQNLETLYKLAEKDYQNISDIKLIYSKDHIYIQENLNFLIDIEIFDLENNKILLKEKREDFKSLLIQKIFKKNLFFLLIKEYIQNFVINENDEYFFEPSLEYNLNTSDLRNFLISLNIIENRRNKYFIIDKKILILLKQRKVSPKQLKKILNDNEKIGLAAETLVFESEVDKVKKINKNLIVKHVALDDVAAGYDILSYNEKQEKIFIEVKAVSSSNFKFYLSSNEFNTAKMNGEKFYLYLLPRDLSNSKKFDYKKILIINNINKNIFENQITWEINNDTYLIHKKD